MAIFGKFAIGFLFALVAVFSGVAHADQGMSRAVVPINMQFENPCTGEMMQTFGSIQILSKTFTGEDGRLHINFKQQMHTLGAVGLDTGTVYKAVGRNQSEQFNGFLFESGAYRFVSRFGYVSHGSEPNWFKTILFHVVANANGDILFDRATLIEVDCR